MCASGWLDRAAESTNCRLVGKVGSLEYPGSMLCRRLFRRKQRCRRYITDTLLLLCRKLKLLRAMLLVKDTSS